MILAIPYPVELLRVARKVVWYDRPEQTLADLKTFLSHLMMYGSSADVANAQRYVPPKNSAECLRILLPECSCKVLGRRGMNNLGCRYRLCPGASFPMARSGHFFGR
jgi:hypothetical protein